AGIGMRVAPEPRESQGFRPPPAYSLRKLHGLLTDRAAPTPIPPPPSAPRLPTTIGFHVSLERTAARGRVPPLDDATRDVVQVREVVEVTVLRRIIPWLIHIVHVAVDDRVGAVRHEAVSLPRQAVAVVAGVFDAKLLHLVQVPGERLGPGWMPEHVLA